MKASGRSRDHFIPYTPGLFLYLIDSIYCKYNYINRIYYMIYPIFYYLFYTSKNYTSINQVAINLEAWQIYDLNYPST
ncbi:hypothetical protein SAMN04488029_3114 [Reichenbachiella faecimaris]|uniref:Uncharacterized protein n=1 Tax=Reichenbachiella faecimaris TaxID=692418 RepID=A0A1W2GJW0_REIFA|nr:hypothetical protein SAMN04488029_3114 [Reichenbachiella faecimaris]